MENEPKNEAVSVREKIGITIGTVWAYIKSWSLIIASKVCVRIFILMVQRPWTGVADVVKVGVVNNTRANVAMFLLRNRIVHCHVCLSLESLRRSADGRYTCPIHYNPAQDLVKP